MRLLILAILFGLQRTYSLRYNGPFFPRSIFALWTNTPIAENYVHGNTA